MNRSLFLYLLLLPFSLIAQNSAKVIGIKDGDTILVLLSDKSQKTLRLAEVDCPESGQPFGKNAKQYTSDQVFGKTSKFIQTDVDRYGRTIAKVYYDNEKYLSEEIIRAGLGWWYFRYSDNKKLGDLENIARNRKIGLWKESKMIAPWEFRKLKNYN